MKASDLKELLELERKLYAQISETIDLTQNLLDSVERNDQVAVHMLLSMRQRPILEMEEVQSYISLKRIDLNHQDAQRFDALLSGALPENRDELPLTKQLSMNQRFLERLTELDRLVSHKLCGDRSYYQNQ
ncbi:MAG: hypothetical protein H6Q61_909 [Firmicutes bacterium]|nr:hypothetical protein [Bacillota bacterium]